MGFVFNKSTGHWERQERAAEGTSHVSDQYLTDIIGEVLLQLKKIELHLSSLSGETIGDEDL